MLKGHTEQYRSGVHCPTLVPEEVEEDYAHPFASEVFRLCKLIALDLHIKAFLHSQEDCAALISRGKS